MNNKIIITVVAAFLFVSASAQGDFILKGKIEFEKRTNVHKQLEMQDEGFRDMIIKTTPPTKTTYFDLFFNDKKTVYTPGREVVVSPKVPDWLSGPASDNIVYTNLDNQVSTSQKNVFDVLYNIEDTIRKLKWKITPETRTIAGFDCRKATAIIMDSIFVVAFYTDQIVTPGGPESFSGLPGMILGLAIPRLYTTWYATKLELIDVKETTLAPPKKGKKTDANSLKTQLNAALKDWGKMGTQYTWQISI